LYPQTQKEWNRGFPEIWHWFIVPECSLCCRDAVRKCQDKCTQLCECDNEHLTNSSHFLWQHCNVAPTSATTLVSVRHTQVFRTALTALTEPRTLWRRITHYPSPRRRVALHSISKIYFSHWSERMWSVYLDASISGVSDPRRAFLPAFRVTGRADDKPGSTWERRRQTWESRRHVWEHLESQSCIQFVFSSMYLCIYVSMYLYSYPSTHGISGLAAGGAWEQFEVRLKMTIEWTQRYTPRPWSSEFGDALGGRGRVNLEINSETMIERVWRCTWRPCSCELAGRNRESLEIHLEAVIERVWRCTWATVIDRVWRCTWRPWSSGIGRVLGGGRWTAHRVMRLYSSVR